MAKSLQSYVQDQMADVTECCICTDVYTIPKILPCVHTFCLKCLEKHGTEKKTGDKMSCPICRGEFLIPDGGLCSLPNNFFIDKMVEIRKFSETSTDAATCGTCPDEERSKATLFCFECEQNLCERCGIAHSKMKHSKNHQIAEIGNKLKLQEVNFRSSYCDHHPGEIVKMYCEDDKATICFLCFAESHQTHKCLSVAKASEEFSSAIRNDLQTVFGRLPEFQVALGQSDKLEKDLLAQIVEAEKLIFDEAVSLKVLIDSHADILMQKLISLKNERLKAIESLRDDAKRFKVSFESYSKYCEELLSKGAPGDICRESNQLKNRARHLISVTNDCFPVVLSCDRVIFKPFNFGDVLRMSQIANVIGDVQEDSVNNNSALIVIHDEVIQAVNPRSHRLEKEKVNVKPCDPWLSLISASGSSGNVPAKTNSGIPTSLSLTFDPRAVYFIEMRPELQKHIEDFLQKLNCRVEWPSKGKGEVKLEYKEKGKPASGWDVECTKILQKYADELTWKKENVLQEIWNDFQKEIQEHTVGKSKLLDIAFENDKCEIQYIGLKKDTDEFEELFRKIKGKLVEELKRRKERISETMTNLKPHQTALICTEEFKGRLKQKQPDIEFEVKQTEVSLCGLPEVVKKAKLFIMENVAATVQDSFEISESMCRVFAKDDAKPYLIEQLHSQGISASWSCNDRSVIVYAFDDKNLKDAVFILENEVIGRSLQLSTLNLREDLFQSREWKDFIRCLYREDKFLDVSVSESVLMVSCMKSSFQRNKERIETFLVKYQKLYYLYGLLLKPRTCISFQWH